MDTGKGRQGNEYVALGPRSNQKSIKLTDDRMEALNSAAMALTAVE